MYNKIQYLKELNRKATTDRQKKEIDLQMQALAEENPAEFEKAFQQSLESSIQELKENTIKSQLSEISGAVSLSYIAKTYFNKTRGWLFQRINSNSVNGKDAKFTPEEIDTLNHALQDISKKISSIRISL